MMNMTDRFCFASRIGKYAIVGAGAIVTKDVGDYEVAVGVPAKTVKKLDQKKFEK